MMLDRLLMKGNVLHLMVQIPENLHAYWDMCPEFLQMATSQIGEVHPGLYLRLVREEDNEIFIDEVFEFPGGQFAGSAYFYKQRPYAAYYAEMGLSYQAGFFALLRSETVLTPPDRRLKELHLPGAEGIKLPDYLPFAYSPVEYVKERE